MNNLVNTGFDKDGHPSSLNEGLDPTDLDEFDRVASSARHHDAALEDQLDHDFDRVDDHFEELNNLNVPLSDLTPETSVPEKASGQNWILFAVGGGIFIVGAVVALAWFGYRTLSGPDQHQRVSAPVSMSADMSSQDPRAKAVNSSTDMISNNLTSSIPNRGAATNLPAKPENDQRPWTPEVARSEAPLSVANTDAVNPSSSTQGAEGSGVNVEKGQLAPATVDAPSQVLTRKGESVEADPINVREGQSVMVSGVGEDVSLTGEPVTDEEKMYDNVLASAPGKDIPSEAIKIDPNVIKRQVAEGQLSKLEEALVIQQQGLKTVSQAVSGFEAKVSGFGSDIAEIKALVTTSGQTQARQFSQLQTAVQTSEQKRDAENVKRDAELRDLRAEIAAIRASQNSDLSASRPRDVRQIANASDTPAVPKNISKPALAQFAPPKPQAQPKAKPVTASPVQVLAQAERAPAVVNATPVADVPKASGCPSTKVSAVWRIKGVTHTSAYLVRVEDGYGLFVREDSEIPGFGVVKSFDPLSRAVCSTAGVVKR